MLRLMCNKDAEGARDVSADYGYPAGQIFVRDSFHGRVLKTWERNGYDDSDFYAVVWNDEKSAPEQIEYATTRGWSYANGAVVDATPEVVEKYRLYRIEQAFQTFKQDDIEDSKVPAAGKRCRVIKGRKIKVGTEVLVKRVEAPVKYSMSRWAKATVNARVVNADSPTDVSQWTFTNIENLEVLNPEQYLKTEAELRKQAEGAINSGCTVYPKRLAAALSRTNF